MIFRIEKLINEYDIEIKARELIQNRQSQYISQLQDELKNAKVILQDRNLRGKFFESLKDYMGDIEKIRADATKSSRKQSAHHRIQSAHRASDLDHQALYTSFNNEKRKKPASATTQQTKPSTLTGRLHTGIFNTFDYSYRSFTPNNHKQNSMHV